jgi:Cohesin domain/Periplasmic copper-binding protein (NosD)
MRTLYPSSECLISPQTQPLQAAFRLSERSDRFDEYRQIETGEEIGMSKLFRSAPNRHRPQRAVATTALMFVFFAACAISAMAQASTNFESFSTGSPNGQFGWNSTGSAPNGPGFDHQIVNGTSLSPAAPATFGARSLRISNAVTSGTFGDQTFSASLPNEAGETSATNGGLSGGTRKNHFEAEFALASVVPGAEQPGLLMSVAPDRGDGARMSYLRFEDQSDGVHVIFDDYQDVAPFGGANGDDTNGCGVGDDFNDIDIATLDRSKQHFIKFVIDFVDGPRNDVVKIYIDGALIHTGTTWEDYFRFCAEQAPDNNTHTVDSLLFRTGGSAVPANSGKGFLIDGLLMSSGAGTTTVDTNVGNPATNPNAWFWYNDETDAVDNSLGTFVNGPGAPPYGTGSAQTSVTGTQRRNLATYKFSGTSLASISTLKFSTYNPSAGNGGGSTRSGYLNFNVDFNGSDSFQRRIAYSPSDNGTVVPNTWKEWDAINGGNALWAYSGPTWPGTATPGATLRTWSDIINSYPGVRIKVTDSFLGIRVGAPYNDGYTEDIDSLKFGTAAGTTVYNFEPLPSTVYVDDNWNGTTPGTDPDGAGPATSFGYDSFSTIQSGIDGVAPNGTVNVAGGTYLEDVSANKSVIISGAGPTAVNVMGPIGGSSSTIAVTTANVEIRGLNISRVGNNTTDWNNAGLNSAGISIQGSFTGTNIHDNYITGNRTGIDINNSSGHSIHNNLIDSNRTGMILRNQTDNLNVFENQITNNWTVGILFLDGSSPLGSNSPVQSAANSPFFNNNLSGNWYGQIADRQSGGSIPAPGTTNLKNFSGNWFGSATPVVTTSNTTEPGYAAQIPVAYGGTATAPGGQPDIAGPASANFDYSPYLTIGGDTNAAVYGFQGNFSALNISASSAQTSATSKIQEANDLISAGGVLSVPPGSYPGNVNINKAIAVNGTFTVGGTLTVSSAGASLSPGYSPGIINSGSLSLASGSNLNMDVNGTIAGSQYDQLNVTGTVNLNNANLNLMVGFAPAAGNTFTIINNDGTDLVTGTFNGLPNNSVFYVGANSFRINYNGGTGNDVVLTSVSLCNAVSIPANITSLTGNTVIAPVNVDDTTGNGLYSTDFWVTYNPAVVSFSSVSLGSVAAGGSLTVNSATAGLIKISVFNSTPFTGAGQLGNITFNAVGGPGTSSPVTFTQFKFNEGTPCVTTSNGLISIISGTITGTVTYGNSIAGPGLPAAPRHVPNVNLNAVGSVNVSALTNLAGVYSLSGLGSGAYTVTPSKTGGDFGGLSGFDSATIAQYVVGTIPFTTDQQTVADVSGTGGITSFDAALIARYVAGLPNYGATGTWRFLPVSRTYPNVNTNQTAQDYTALLMGDVTGNWFDPSAMRPAPIVFTGRPVNVSLPDMRAESGSKIVVPISISDATGKGIVSYEFDLAYDAAVLEPLENVTGTKQTVSDGLTVTTNANTPGLLKVVVYGALPISGEGRLLDLKFNVIGSANSSSALTWQAFRFNEGGVFTETGNGRISVTESNTNDSAITGRLLTTTGQGVPNNRVTITDTNGESRTVLTNGFGTYRFSGLEIGQTYTITADPRRYVFAPQTVSAGGGVVNVDLIAEQ